MSVNAVDETQNNHTNNGTRSSISDRIAKVIQKRQELASRVKPVKAHLEALLREIQNLNQQKIAIQPTLEISESRENLENLNLNALEKSIRTELDRIEQLEQRFSRHTLNIGVVGLTGQGKSTFLKSLSGLSDNEIPARSGGACTAVRSKIEHHDAETKAIVILHSESSFVKEVITPYYIKLALGKPPSSLDEFASQPLPEPPQGVTHQTMYDHLKNDYYLPFKNYRELLKPGKPREIEINQEEIPTYVMQQRDAEDRLTTFKHLAVREVQIFCRFSKTDVSRLGLVDVPGLGDTRLGDEDLMLTTLGREVDIVLFLRRPDSKRYQWLKYDTDLYDIAAKALPDLGDRAFMVLNHQTEGNNLDACRAMRDKQGEMKFVTCEIANCAQPDEAQRILDLILQYLDQHIQALEERYARSRQKSLIELHHTIQSELSRARHAIRSSAQENRLFKRLFKDTMQDLANGLRDLVETLASEQNTIDPDFEAVVKGALATCENDSGIPSEAEIRDRTRSLDLHDSYKAAYCIFIPEMRAHLSKNFLALDDGLQQAANKLKERVAQVLVEKGGLGNLTDARGVEFLETITDLLAECDNSLEVGFRTLTTFNISYGALILRLIRQNLMSVLDSDEVVKNHELRETATEAAKVIATTGIAVGVPATTPISPELVGQVVQVTDQLATAVLNSVFEFDAKHVRGNLQHLHQQAVQKCRETLDRWLEAPSQIRYYMATEFVDRVLDASNMKEEWDDFLRDPEIRAKVWSEFRQIEAMKASHQGWLDAVQKILDLNQRDRVEFLN